MSSHALTDKSGLLEAAFGGFLLDAGARFAEPGIEPHYAPDLGFILVQTTLHLTIDPEARTLIGEATLEVRPLPSGMGEVSFDFDDLDVDSVENADTGEALAYRHGGGKLRVRGVGADGARIRIHWSGTPTRGLYFTGPVSSAPKRPHMAWSQCQDEDAHFFFPCVDHPGVKAPMDIRVTVPEGYQAIPILELGQDLVGLLALHSTYIPAEGRGVQALVGEAQVARKAVHIVAAGHLRPLVLAPANPEQ